MKVICRLIVMAFVVCISGCFGGLGDINETARPALTQQYMDYLNNAETHKRVDAEWLESVATFRKAGWRKPFHPWGDRALKSMGIQKVRAHQYSNQ